MELTVQFPIRSFTEIDFPPNVTSVICRNCPVKNFIGLPSTVEFLNINHNSIYSFEGLDDIAPRLHTIKCNKNKIKNFRGLPESIKIMYCIGNKIESWAGLPTNIEYINVTGNRLINFEDLPHCPNLQQIDCAMNAIMNFTGLDLRAPNLHTIDCLDNNIVSFHGLGSKVKIICCVGNHIVSVSGLPASVDFIDHECNPIGHLSLEDMHYMNRWFKGLEILKNLRLHYSVHYWWM